MRSLPVRKCICVLVCVTLLLTAMFITMDFRVDNTHDLCRSATTCRNRLPPANFGADRHTVLRTTPRTNATVKVTQPKRKAKNPFKVLPSYAERLKGRVNATSSGVLCTLFKKAHASFLNRNSSVLKEGGVADYFPPDLLSTFDRRPAYNKCAIVGSSSFMNNSSLGSEIDMHDAVLRFNFAPVKNHEPDVGSKTTIRLFNNQLLEKASFTQELEKFEDIGRNVTFIMWKGAEAVYDGNLTEWYVRVPHFLKAYIDWTRKHPDIPLHVVNPVTLWRGWDIIQEFFNKPVGKIIPSSGFIGVLVMLPLCGEISVYGMVKPRRDVHDVCHYYVNRTCPPIRKPYHPLEAERNVLRMLNTGSRNELERKGKVTFPGFSSRVCL
ncbi:beta-galactoside alpha-2,6-sialyltransferase 2-like [Ptychodera flava]|uniref:beta-galactoside alpha-2,6-sialyltransferase 2-like n=1 Tax=Ptychodera flava TaxID=63121 RepID=UPI00396A31B7